MPNTITLKGTPIRKEGVTDEAVTPGHLVERGGSNDVQKHSTAGGNASRAFALENDLVGDAIGDAYASGETVQIGYFPPGAEVNAFLAYGENVALGAFLESDGNGALQAHVAAGSDVQTEALVGVALEAVNNTTASGEARIKIEVL